MKPTYEQLEQQLAAVVAENAGLTKFIKDDCWVWDDISEDHFDAANCIPETPATDAYLAEVRVQVWIEAKALAKSAVASDSIDHIDFLFDGKAAQLRQGGEK